MRPNLKAPRRLDDSPPTPLTGPLKWGVKLWLPATFLITVPLVVLTLMSQRGLTHGLLVGAFMISAASFLFLIGWVIDGLGPHRYLIRVLVVISAFLAIFNFLVPVLLWCTGRLAEDRDDMMQGALICSVFVFVVSFLFTPYAFTRAMVTGVWTSFRSQRNLVRHMEQDDPDHRDWDE
jgi:hypothetical protein